KADEPVQSFFVSFDFTSKFLNLEIPCLADNEIAFLMETSAPHTTAISKLTSSLTTIPPLPPLYFNPLLQQQTPKTEMPELKQTNQFAKAVSPIPAIVDQYLTFKMKEVVSVAIQMQTNKLREEAQAENQDFLNQTDQTIKRISTMHWSSHTTLTKTSLPHMVMLCYLKEDEIIKTRMKTPLLDQTKGRREGNLVKMLHPLKIQEEPSHIVEESGMQQDQEFVTRDNDEQLVNNETKPATYELKWNKDLVLELWSAVVVTYDQHTYYGTSHWGPNANATTDMNKTAYTSHSDPQGIIYVDSLKRKRLMRTDELHKSSDGTLNDVRSALHEIAAENGISANEKMEQLRQEKGSGYGLGDKKAALSEEVDAESGILCWWKTLWARPTVAGKDHMILSNDVLIIT
nr:hypothetical protein [Tanacetum cinerariifolium]